MILRTSIPHTLLLLVSSLLLFSLQSALAADEEPPFNCHITLDKLTYDLTKLDGVREASQTRSSPPTTMVDKLRFNLCSNLAPQDGVAERDQCPTGTRACLTTTNQKPDDQDRVVAVVPIAQTSVLKPTFNAITTPKGIKLVLHGPEYPHPIDLKPVAQSLVLTLTCDPEKTSDPKLVSYDGAEAKVEWSAPEGCPFGADEDLPAGDNGDKDQNGDKKPGDPERSVGSGLGFFFLVLIFAFVMYFALGAYYNYSTYGASGADLIPHRDFWKEVPYMLRDVVSHMCSGVRPRRSASRGGYIAV